MPNPKKPTALRELHGTANRNKQRNIDSPATATRGIGPAGNVLSENQRAIWDEIVGISYAGVMGEADRIALELMCRLVEEMRLNFAEMSASKMTQLNSILSKFGMTPSDRTKITVPKIEKANGFAALHGKG